MDQFMLKTVYYSFMNVIYSILMVGFSELIILLYIFMISILWIPINMVLVHSLKCLSGVLLLIAILHLMLFILNWILMSISGDKISHSSNTHNHKNMILIILWKDGNHIFKSHCIWSVHKYRSLNM